MVIAIREAVAADAPQVQALYEVLTQQRCSVLPSRIAEIGANDANFLFVAERDSQVVGTVFVTLCLDVMYTTKPFAVVENLIVAASLRNAGIGEKLMRYVEAHCLKHNCSKIMLLSAAHRIDAHRFFSSLGYEQDRKVGFVKYRSKLVAEAAHQGAAPALSASMTIVRTQHLILRQLCVTDGEAMDGVLGDSEVMRFSDGIKTPAQVRRWIDRWIDDLYHRWRFGMWAVVRECDELTIGYCGLSRFPGRVCAGETEIGFRLARPFWGRGFATEAVRAVRDHAFETLKLPKLVALLDPANVASIRVVQKADFGYEREALLEGYDHADRVYSAARPTGG